MKRIALTVAALAFASMAWAHNCPNEVKAIDAALPKAKLDAKQQAEVMRLRDEGEQLHKAGKHSESMATLGKAKGILGIK
ncbi:MAG TPA: hypothetical protein VGP97_22925 [Burkholderiales bacterium]|jgi:hypothetical protein|nr:hypothetical protein [Burkholderiales bacterium]